MFNWLQKNRSWVFSGIGVAVCGAILSLILNKNANQQNISGSGNILGGRDVTVYENPPLSQRQIDDNYPLKEHPVINLDIPIESQVQLFATDKVKIYAVHDLQAVWFGSSWVKFVDGKEYMVVGIPGEPVIPKFEGKGILKMEITYISDRDKRRDLR